MQILKLKGFLFEPNDPAVYDRDSKTVLELCGRLGYKINELIDEYNRFYDEMIEKYNEAYDYMVTHLEDFVDEKVREQLPLVVAEQLPAVASDIIQELYGTTIEQIVADLSTLSGRVDNVEERIGYLYTNISPFKGIADLKANGTNLEPGTIVSTLYYQTEGDEGNASYLIVDSLETGETADDETIIKITDVDLWAKLVVEDIVKTSCFTSVQDALDFAFANNRNLLVIGTREVDDLIVPYDTNNANHTIVIEGQHKLFSVLDFAGQIKQDSTAFDRNFSFKNIGLHKRANVDDSIIDIDRPVSGSTRYLFDNCSISNCYLKLGDGTDPQDIRYMQNVLITDTTFSSSNVEFEYLWDAIFERCSFSSTSTYYFQYPLHITNGSRILFDSCNFNDYQTGLAFKIEDSQDIRFNNCDLQFLDATAVPVVFNHVNNSVMENSMFISTNQQNSGIYIYGSTNFSFNNVKLGGSTLMGSAVFYESCSFCSMYDVTCSLSTEKLVSFYNCNWCTLRKYMGDTGYDIASATNGGNNIAFLNQEEDIQYFSGNGFTYVVPTEKRIGTTNEMNDVDMYEGRVFYNTDTSTINYAHNNTWLPFGGSGGGSDAPIYYYKATSQFNTSISWGEYGSLNFDGATTDFQKFADILNDAHSKNHNYGLILSVYSNQYAPDLIEFSFAGLDFTSASGTIRLTLLNSTFNNSIYKFGVNNAGKIIRQWYLSVNLVNGEIVSWNPAPSTFAYFSEDCYLSTSNTFAYTPTGDYNPATKHYVDYDSFENLTSSLVFGSQVQSYSGDPIYCSKQGLHVTIRGKLVANGNTIWSNAFITLPSSCTPNPAVTSSYSILTIPCLHYKSGATTPTLIMCYVIHNTNATECQVKFSPIDPTETFDNLDSISFSLTYDIIK